MHVDGNSIRSCSQVASFVVTHQFVTPYHLHSVNLVQDWTLSKLALSYFRSLQSILI